MTGQNIKKYQQKKLNLICKTDNKQEIIFSLPRNKSRENWLCKNEFIFHLEDKTKPNTTGFLLFYYNG